MGSCSPGLVLGRTRRLCCSDEEETGSERVRGWTRPHSMRDELGPRTWAQGCAVRSVAEPPQRDVQGGNSRRWQSGRGIAPFLPGSPFLRLCCAFPSHLTTLSWKGSPGVLGAPRLGCNGGDKASCGSRQVFHLPGPQLSQGRGVRPPESLPGPDAEGGQCLWASSFIHSLSSDLEAGLEVLSAELLAPQAQRSGGDSAYTKTGQLCLSRVTEQRRVCDIFSRS